MTILDEYREQLPAFVDLQQEVTGMIRKTLDEAGLIVAALESRIKTEKSLKGKLDLKGYKYHTLSDITDILGVRVITFYLDDVDKVASFMERLFEIDWDNSVDKRKIHQVDSFGYLSLHYICRLKGSPWRFEVQMRTLLQHAWANMNHDTGYKSDVEIPLEYRRNMMRIAGMLELVDEQFSKIRVGISDYRRRVQSLVASGNLDEVPLDGDTFRSYLRSGPFDELNRKIAAVNQAEIQDVSVVRFFPLFKNMGFKTLGDIHRMINDYSEGAFQLACYQLGVTDLDIIASSTAPQDLCIAYLVHMGAGKAGVKMMLDCMNGPSSSHEMLAELLVGQCSGLPFMNQKNPQ